MGISTDLPYVWNISVNIKMAGKVQRVSSRNHQVDIQKIQFAGNQEMIQVTLADSEK